MSTNNFDEIFKQGSKLATSHERKAEVARFNEEWEALSIGWEDEVKATEMASIWKYAVVRTDLFKDEKDLSTEEKLWKTVYSTIDRQLKEYYKSGEVPKGLERIKDLSQLQRKLAYQMTIKDLPKLIRPFEEELTKLDANICVHLDHSNSTYWKYSDSLQGEILKAEIANDALKSANALLEISDAYSKSLVATVKKLKDELSLNLFTIGKVIENIQDITSRTLYEKWLNLTRGYFLVLIMASNLVNVDYELGLECANMAIKADGNSSKMQKNSKRYENLTALHVMLTSVVFPKLSKQREIEKEREKLGKELSPSSWNIFKKFRR